VIESAYHGRGKKDVEGRQMKELDPTTTLSIDNVLFATDFSPATEAALSYALAIAGRYDSKLYVAHVINLESFDLLESESARVMIKQAHDEADRRITQLLDPLRLQRDRYQIVVAEGAISEVLMDIVQRNHIDLAVLGTHGRRAFKKLLLGSVAEEVLRMAPCPVMTVGPKTAPALAKRELRHILYPAEFAPDLSKAARYAVSLAERYAAILTVMNVREDMPASSSTIEEFPQPMKRWIQDHVREDSDLRQRIRFERGFGPAADSILDFAVKAEVDIIVMSVRHLDPVIAARLSKSGTVHELVSRAPCPVLTIRA
jgi:nucleotide-binding universal stress UspA family protein